MRSVRLRRLLAALALASPAAGCGLIDGDDLFTLPDVNLDALGDISLDPSAGKGLGLACVDKPGTVSECRFGLRCLDGTCQAIGATAQDRPCLLTAECQDGLFCGVRGLCEPAGAGAAGAACATAADCQRGLACLTTGFIGACAPAGTGDLGAPCDGAGACAAGLICGPDAVCDPGSVVFGLRPWPGVSCAPPDDAGPPRVYFEVPRPGVSPADFFRLPFPNDIRLAGGHLDLSGFPTPGPGLVGFDPVARIVDAAEAVQTGFSTVPVVIFRFSNVFDLASVWGDGVASPPPGEPTLYFLDITLGSPGYNTRPAYGYALTDGGSRYLCPRSLSVKPSWDHPLRPATTYAVILARGVKTGAGVELAADADQLALLAAARPADATLGAAWDAYAPLRTYLADPAALLGADRVLAAAVFTTQTVDDLLPAVREAIRATPPAVPSALTLCDDGVASPCDDGLTGEAHVRGCFTASPAAHELHLRLPLPRLQAGARPYLRPEDGGDVPRAADGAVLLQGTEEVCASLTLPRGVPMPPAGWPLALYAHGTGGSFRSAVRDAGLPLSAIPVGDVTVGLAVVGWDGPMHGERRGAELDPEGLFYNFGNPRAARGNLAQGAADVFALVQAFEGLVIPAAESPTGEEIRFDPSHFALIGHSQGGTTGPLAAAFEPGIALDVWSGAGAGLVASLLAKTAPVDVPSALSVALQEVTESGLVPVNDLHPVLALIQGLFDPFDPLNHAGALADRPRPGQRPQHVLQVVGRDDHYTPNSTALTFGRLMRLALAKPLQIPEAADFLQLAPPIAGNVTRGEHTVTAVQVQTTPGDYDGHFVMFRDAATNAQYTQFLGTWLVDGVPTVIAR